MRHTIGTRLTGVAIVLEILCGERASAQNFTSGSDGSDGALNLTGTQTIIFDPHDTATFGRQLDADGDNVYHFTTINVGAGVTVKLRGDHVDGPVYWLASGAVQIDGTVDLSGADGHPMTTVLSERNPSVPGAGGFLGGVGGNATTGLPPEPGAGPSGGAGQKSGDCHGGHGSISGNAFLVPLHGGSGGGGGYVAGALSDAGNIGLGGGAGGGAILIASSTSIALTGTILANGGNSLNSSYSLNGGGGAGGMIHLLAPSITGSGSLHANGGSAYGCGSDSASSGMIRVEAFQQGWTGTSSPQATTASPYRAYLPTAHPRVRVTAIDNVALAAYPPPTASFTTPDVTIPSGSSVPVDIEAHDIPPGTTVNVFLFSENGPDLSTTATLAGTLASSTATAVLEIPPGFSRSYVRVTFTPQ